MAQFTFTTVLNDSNDGNQKVSVSFAEGTVIEFIAAHYPNIKKRDEKGNEDFIKDASGQPKQYLRFKGTVDGVPVDDLNLTMFTRNKADIDKDGNTRAVYSHEGAVYEAILNAIKGKATLKEQGDAAMDLFRGKKFIVRVTHSWWISATMQGRILDLEEVPAE